jgi:hypothetical protein
VLAAVVGGYALAQVLPLETLVEKPTATTLILINRQQPTLLDRSQPVSGADLSTFQRTQAGLVKSRFVLLDALRDPSIADLKTIRAQGDPVKWLEENLQTDFDLSPEILRVSLKGWSREDIKQILNKVTDTYLQEIEKDDERVRAERRQRLHDASTRYQHELDARRRQFRDLTEAAGAQQGSGSALQQQTLQEDYAAIAQERRRIHLALLADRSKLQILRAKKPDPDVQAKCSQLEEDINLLSEQHKLLTKEMAQVSRQLRDTAGGGVELENAKDELDKVSAMAHKLRDLVEASDLESSSQNRVRILQRTDVR